MSDCLNGLLSGGLAEAVATAGTSGPCGSSGSLKPGGRKAEISSSLIKKRSSGDLVVLDASTDGPSGPSGSLNPGGRKAEMSSCLVMNLSTEDVVVDVVVV